MRPKDDDGATATEYALLLAGIAVVVMVAILGYGLFLKSTWQGTTSCIQTQVNQAGGSCS